MYYIFTACAPTANQLKHEVTMQKIDARQLYNQLQQGECPYYILDVREQYERDQRAIQPSYHVPLDQIDEQTLEDVIPKDQSVVVYCHAGKRSAKAAQQMLQWGWQDVYNLTDGILGWAYVQDNN